MIRHPNRPTTGQGVKRASGGSTGGAPKHPSPKVRVISGSSEPRLTPPLDLEPEVQATTVAPKPAPIPSDISSKLEPPKRILSPHKPTFVSTGVVVHSEGGPGR